MMLAFGPFTVDVMRRTVSKNGVPVRLTLKCVELLIAFVRNPGKPLSKQQLLEAAWHDPEASDATLAQHIFLLRRVLRHENHEWIRTIPNVGYRFTGEVSAVEPDDDVVSRTLDAYLEGARTFRAIGTERALRSSIDLCGHALAMTDASARAYALRASCWRLLAESMHAEPLPCLQSAKSDAHAALMRDAQNADARIEAAFAALLLDRDVAVAHRHACAVQDLQPQHVGLATLRVLLAIIDGRTDEALHVARHAGGPLYAVALYFARDFDRARTLLEAAEAPNGGSRLVRGASRLMTGNMNGALEDFTTLYYGDPGAADAAPNVQRYAIAYYIAALARSGDVARAQKHAATLERIARRRYVSPMARAVAQLALGNTDGALALIEEALRRADPWASYLLVDPMLDELREHPRFCDLAKQAA
jgi:DNA-binding winged helix-turn-helix (wHTH) protein